MSAMGIGSLIGVVKIKKWEIDCDYQGLKPLWINKVNGFPTFGHFENEEDCKRAIDLFGKEIKELFVDCEG